MAKVVYQGINLTQMQANVATLQADVANLTAQLANFKATPGPQGPAGPEGPPGPAGAAGATFDPTAILAQIAAIQQSLAALQTVVAAIQASSPSQQPAPPPTTTPPASSTFTPPNPTANDIYTSAATLVIADTLSRNIICTGGTPTQVQSQIENGQWVEQPDVTIPGSADVGKVWQEVHSTGQTLTLWFCAPGVTYYIAPAAPPAGGSTSPPVTAPPSGLANINASTLTPAPAAAAAGGLPADSNLVTLILDDGTEVIHLGQLLPPPPADGAMASAYHLGPYSFTAPDGSTVTVPCHWWNAEVLVRKAPITIKKAPADLVKAKRMFAYGKTGAAVVPPPPARVKSSIMGSSSITIIMPTTGERPDIGLITDPSAYYMLGGDPGQMGDWALSAASCPIYFMDQATKQPIDLIQYPLANAYDQPGYQGSPFLPKGPPNPPPASQAYSAYGGGWQPQQAHFCEMNYVAFMATGDLGFLRALQYSANFVVLTDAARSGVVGVATVSGEQRGIGWGIRELFMAHIATADAEAGGLKTGPGTLWKPSSYFQTLLDNALASLTALFVNSTDPTQATFHLVGALNRFGPWQQDYVLSSMAFGILTGHSEWGPIYLFALKNAVDRTSGASGYPPGWGGAYYLNTYAWAQNADGTYNQNAFDTTKPLTWNESFLFQVNDPNGARPTPAQLATLAETPLNGGVAMGGWEYLETTRAVIAQAQYIDTLGLLAVRTTFPDLDTCFANVDAMVQNSAVMEPRHAITADPTVAPTTIVAYTP